MAVTLLNLSDEQLWSANYVVLPAWLLLLLFPRQRFTHQIVIATTALMSLLYVLLFLGLTRDDRPHISMSDMGSFEGVHKLLSDKRNVLVAWVHYLAFDVLIGKYIVDNNTSYGLSQFIIAPCLVLCLLLGPTGLLLYLVLRTILGSKPKVK